MMKSDSLIQGISADRTWAGRVGDDGIQGACQHHDDDLSHDVVSSAARDRCRHRSLESQLQGVACDQGVRHRHPHGRPCIESGRDRQLLRRGYRQVQDVRSDAGASQEDTPPLIAECLANIECRVTDVSLVRKYNLFILKPVKAWIDPERKERRTIHHNGDGTFVVDGRVLDLRKKMVKWPDFP